MSKCLINTCVFILCIILLITCRLEAQRFQLGIIGGVNLSELEGEDISSNFGLNTGLKVKTTISKGWSLSTELLYSQAGEYVLPTYYPPVNYGKIRLDYLEIPLSINRQFYPKDDYYQKQFSLGVSYVQLVNYEAADAFGTDITPQIIWDKKKNIIGHLGISHFFNKKTVLNFRAALGKNENTWSWSLAFRGIYFIVSMTIVDSHIVKST